MTRFLGIHLLHFRPSVVQPEPQRATESKKIGPHQKGNKGNDDEQSSKEKVTKGNGRKIIFWTKQKKNINTTDVTEY